MCELSNQLDSLGIDMTYLTLDQSDDGKANSKQIPVGQIKKDVKGHAMF